MLSFAVPITYTYGKAQFITDDVLNGTTAQISFHSQLFHFNAMIVMYNGLNSINSLWSHHTVSLANFRASSTLPLTLNF